MSTVELPNDPHHIIFAPHPVRRIAWRPNHDTEIAVVSTRSGISDVASPCDRKCETVTADSNDGMTDEDESRLEIWDVRRSYVAKYTLGQAARFGANGAASDILWADGSHGQALQACYSNGAFIQIDTQHHRRPLDFVPRQALCWGNKGELVAAIDRWVVGEVPFDDM
jgi:WD repeat-containing protein 24